MLLTADLIPPRTLSEYARAALRDYPTNQPSLTRYLPYNPVDDLEFRLLRGDSGLTQLAPFRSYDTESSIAGRRGLSRVSGQLPPISRKKILGEYDRLRRRADSTGSIEDAIFNDVDNLVAEIAMSFEVEIGDALTNGSVTPPGLQETVSFGRSGGNSVTANILWSTTATADPITDLRTWIKYYRQLNGVRPGSILLSDDIFTYLLQNAAIRSLAGTILGTPTILDEATLNTIMSRNGIPPVEVYEVQYDSDGAGTAARVIPNNVVLLLPAPVDPNSPQDTKLGATFLGSPAETDDPRFDLADSRAGIVAGSYTQEDPPGRWTKASAIGIATLANADLSMKAVVAA
jgi:hypothetical protein